MRCSKSWMRESMKTGWEWQSTKPGITTQLAAEILETFRRADSLLHLGTRAGHLDMIIDDPDGAVFDKTQFSLVVALARCGRTRQSQ